MVDKSSAPSFSIGGGKKSSFLKDNGLPGPGAYQTISYMKANNSQDRLGKGKRFNDYATSVPGPGTYSNKNSQHIPTALVLSRATPSKIEKIPGPGSYEPDFHKVVKSNSGYKIGNSPKHVDLTANKKFLPGPGAYQTAKSSLLGLNQAVAFGPERKIELGIDPKTPGPGQYQQKLHYNGDVSQQPNTVFGKSSRSLSTKNFAPGPGAYSINTDVDQSIKKAKGYVFGSKLEPQQESNLANPGPGSYSTTSVSKLKKSSPSFSIGKDQKLKIENFRQIMSKPGPLNYQNKVTALEKRSVIIGKDKRKGLGIESNVPGPGAYEYKTLMNPKTYSVGKSSRKGLEDNKPIPGPQQYDPKPIFKTQYQNIGIGRDHRRTFEIKQKGPGPGQYKTESEKKNVGGYNFGKQKRDQLKAANQPGPGQYEIPSTISNVPHYVSTSKK